MAMLALHLECAYTLANIYCLPLKSGASVNQSMNYFDPNFLFDQFEELNHGSLIMHRCQGCGVTRPTKYVEFYQNIGLLFMRQTKSLNGCLALQGQAGKIDVMARPLPFV